MIVLRLLLILSVIGAVSSFAFYLFSGDQRYKRFAWQIIKFTLVLFIVAGAVFAMGRIILF